MGVPCSHQEFKYQFGQPTYKNIAKVNTKVAPDQLQRPVAVSNRFSPLYEVEDFKETSVHDTLNDIVCNL